MPATKYIKNALKHLPTQSPKALKTFIEVFYRNIAISDIERLTPQEIIEIAQLHWNESRNIKPGQPIIKIRNEKPVSGKHLGRTVIDIINKDMTFLVDSVAAMLIEEYRDIHILVHPLIYVKTNSKGSIIDVLPQSSKDTKTQSHIHIELTGLVPKNQLPMLEADLRKIIRDVYFATRDWQKMRKEVLESQQSLSHLPNKKYSKAETQEYINFLQYIHDHNFTLLGYREYKFLDKKGEVQSSIVKGNSLGLLSDDVNPVYINKDREGLSQSLQRFRKNLPPVSISKINNRSTVHRTVPMDAIAVKKYDKKGNIVGEHLFIGLFTSVTYSRSIQDIPLLRKKAKETIERSKYRQGSHNDKALRHILEKYPRDELFQMTVDELLNVATSILKLQERRRIALYLRTDPFGRYVSCLVYVPKERYETRLREKMLTILEKELKGVCQDYHVNLDDSPYARVLFVINTDINNNLNIDVKKIENKLKRAGSIWKEDLFNTVYTILDNEQDVITLVDNYGEAFPINYQDYYTEKQAYYDILQIEKALQQDSIICNFYTRKDNQSGQFQLKIFHVDSPVQLSSVLPILESMGLKTISEVPFEIHPASSHRTIWIHDFLVELEDTSKKVNVKKQNALLKEMLIKIWYGAAENDDLNQLVLYAGLEWRKVTILRTYVRYMRQMKYPYDTTFIERTLAKNSSISKMLINLFEAQFDPRGIKTSKNKINSIIRRIDHALESVISLDEDVILRSLSNIICSSLRTNYYQTDENNQPKSYLSIKLDSKRIKGLPEPKPYREIFVYAPHVEAIHLRGDVLARGGIRWSDRPEDFRTEILGLMKAQQVKNSVIVPMGAKGGFIVKNPPTSGGRDAFIEEGIRCYKTLIRGLLDITDNLDGNKIIPPVDVVRLDGDDPYLVVAADKGTASFSDIANSISQDYGFWMDDAFASGGSAGYDHKEMGITARGAWESVKRHFRELNHNIQKQDFDVIGVGDMGGDVFGNGMLLSKHICLVGAFNHLHIFCDPSPNPATSYKERQRLFKVVKGWDSYNTKLLSKGGRVYSRSDKSLPLTAEIKKRFDIESDTVTPAELMNAMLKARTDLLWFGGIGTYIKNSMESHTEVGDKANDQIRVDAPDVRAKAIGEGANLAITHRARIQFAKMGGKINADFIDNSGGVDSSDHEVNIKILLSDVMKSKKHNMTLKKRNALLEKMTEEVANLVLDHNYNQAQAISLMAKYAAPQLENHAEMISDMENRFGLNRKLEALPDVDQIAERKKMGRGLTRPELATLQSYAKIELTKNILKTHIPDSEFIQNYWLSKYFPDPLVKNYKTEILRHKLKRDIVATLMATEIINRMGATFVDDMIDRTGATYEEIISAFLVTLKAYEFQEFWDKIENLDYTVLSDIQLTVMHDTAMMIERHVFWILRHYSKPVDIEKESAVLSNALNSINNNILQILPRKMKKDIQGRKKSYVDNGFPVAIAKTLSLIPVYSALPDILRITEYTKSDIKVATKLYLTVGERFRFDWLLNKAAYLPVDDRWDREAKENLIVELYAEHALLSEHILNETNKTAKQDISVDILKIWKEKQGNVITLLDTVLSEMKDVGHFDLAILIIATQRLRNLRNV